MIKFLFGIIFVFNLVACGNESSLLQEGTYSIISTTVIDDWKIGNTQGQVNQSKCTIKTKGNLYTFKLGYEGSEEISGAEDEGKIVFYQLQGDMKYNCPSFVEFSLELIPNEKDNGFTGVSFSRVDMVSKSPTKCDLTTWYTYWTLVGTKD